jgi:hypothetical protein
MSKGIKALLLATMTAGLSFGFLDLFIPGHNFERLHIFLFNLCGGGTIIFLHTEARVAFSARSGAFYVLSVLFGLSAFFELYAGSIAIAITMALLVESVRMKRFSFFPVDFFRGAAPVKDKFHQASLLCLSIGLVISALVILNNEYLKLVSNPKLKLDIFFLAFSFPVSLITMSVMFGMIRENGLASIRVLKNFSFWAVNLGVIIFFLFILLQMVPAELTISIILFITVIIIFILYSKRGMPIQPKAFLTSGVSFLIMTAITGIVYILMYALDPHSVLGKPLLKLHALISLYGWNLSGLAVICRYDDFPIGLHSGRIILFHWIIVCILAPLGLYYRPFAIIAVLLYALFLAMIFFTRGTAETPAPAA